MAEGKLQTLTQKDLASLAQDPSNVVCHYTQDKAIPVEERLSPEEVWKRAKEVYSVFLKEKVSTNSTTARATVVKLFPDFRRTHPLIFDRLTSSTTTGHDLKMIQQLCSMFTSNQKDEWKKLVDDHYRKQ